MRSNRLITYTTNGHVASLDLTHQVTDIDNAYELVMELGDITAEIGATDMIRIVVVNAGGKALSFSTAGMGAFAAALGQMTGDCPNAAELLAGLPQPVLVGLEGDILGMGLELALACDLRVAVDGARFGMTHLAEGQMPSWGGTQRLSRLVGRGNALGLTLGATIIDAPEALRIGLVNKVVPRDRLSFTLEEMAHGMAAKGPIALRYAKEAINAGMDLSLGQGLRLEADLYFLLHTSRDRTEGIRAFQNKSIPKFESR